MILLNSLTLNEKTYSLKDNEAILELEDVGKKVGFYGGRVDKIARAKDAGIFICLEKMEPIDLLVDISKVKRDILVDIARIKRVEIPNKATKDEIIKLLRKR